MAMGKGTAMAMVMAKGTAMVIAIAMAIAMQSPIGTVAATRKPANNRHPIPDTRDPRSPKRKSALIELRVVVMDARGEFPPSWLRDNVIGRYETQFNLGETDYALPILGIDYLFAPGLKPICLRGRVGGSFSF